MENVLVSVIIPVYNTEKYLIECIESIRIQTLKNIEIICIDDGSTDNSLELLKKYECIDTRIKIIVPGGNHGQAFARNCGVNAASGEYIVYVDSDDILSSDSILEKIYSVASAHELDVLVFGADAIYELKDVNDTKFYLKQYGIGTEVMTGQRFISETMESNQFIPNIWTKIWKRSFLSVNNISFKEDTSPHEDLLYVLEALMVADRVKYIDEICYYYRWREGSSTSTQFSLKRLKAYVLIYNYLIKAFEKNMLEEKALYNMFLYIKTIKSTIQTKAIDLIKSGIDVSACDFDNVFNKIRLFEIITEKYQHIGRPLSPSEYENLKSSSAIYVYGAGVMGKEIMSFISEYGFDYIPVVSSKNECQKVNGKDILEFSESNKDCNGAYIVAVADQKAKNDIIKTLKSYGINNILYLR